jgi:hypothetical protein
VGTGEAPRPDDVQRLRVALRSIEADAQEQVWDAQRPWRVATHVDWESGVPVVDLHDLKARNARTALKRLVGVAESLEGGAVGVVTGRGRHSLGPGVLRRMAGDILVAAAADRDAWSVHPRGSGSWVLVTDPARAPAATRGGPGMVAAVFFALMALALAWLLLH